VKLRRSLMYDLIQRSFKVGHSVTKSSKVTFMRSLSASRTERRCYAYSCAVTYHRTQRPEHWSKKCWWHWRRLQLQAVHFLMLRRSLIYDQIQGSWKVRHSFMKSREITVCDDCRLAEKNDGVMLIHLWFTNHRTLSARQWSKMCGWLWRRWTSCFAQIYI